MSKKALIWKKAPERGDYAAAGAFLSLIFPSSRAKSLAGALRTAPKTEYSAKDLLRASGLPLLPQNETSVSEDLKRIGKGKALSPVLLVRGDIAKGVPLIVADGYHRIGAVYYYDEHAPVAVRTASLD